MALGKLTTPEEREKIISLYYSDMTGKEIADSVGRSYPLIIKIWQSAGLPKRMTKLQKDVKTFREKGMCCTDYPSIDHVYPLSKGGDHVWSNVRLAHHYCNTIKSNKVVAYG